MTSLRIYKTLSDGRLLLWCCGSLFWALCTAEFFEGATWHRRVYSLVLHSSAAGAYFVLPHPARWRLSSSHAIETPALWDLFWPFQYQRFAYASVWGPILASFPSASVRSTPASLILQRLGVQFWAPSTTPAPSLRQRLGAHSGSLSQRRRSFYAAVFYALAQSTRQRPGVQFWLPFQRQRSIYASVFHASAQSICQRPGVQSSLPFQRQR